MALAQRLEGQPWDSNASPTSRATHEPQHAWAGELVSWEGALEVSTLNWVL